MPLIHEAASHFGLDSRSSLDSFDGQVPPDKLLDMCARSHEHMSEQLKPVDTRK